MVIHAEEDGKSGPIIGHAPVNVGSNSDVLVEVDAAAVTDVLYAMLHIDAGDDGEFVGGTDGSAKDTEGNTVVTPFNVSVETANTNAVIANDQAIGADNTVVINSVTADVAGFMVIHAEEDGKSGPIIGHAPVNAGSNSDVLVEVDAAAVTDVLYAMLHIDAGDDGEFVGGTDGSAKDTEGNTVVTPFAIEEDY